MARRVHTLSKLLADQQLACEALSTPERPVTLDLVRREPTITPQLEAMAATLLKEIPVLRETLDAKGKRKTIMEHIFPYGIGKDLATAWPQLLKMSDQPEARRLMDLYESLEKALRDSLPVEAFCYAADIPSARILGILTGVIVEQGARASSILVAVWNPRVVEKTIERALQDSGTADRHMIHRATGFLPMPKGATTIVNVQQNAARQPAVTFVPAPPPEATIRQLADALNEPRDIVPARPLVDANVDLSALDPPAAHPSDEDYDEEDDSDV